MMTKNNSLRRASFIKLATVPLFAMLTISLTFSQVVQQPGKEVNNQNEWWYPFLKKHGYSVDKNNFTILFSADKGVDGLYENVKVVFNEGDTAILIVEAPRAIVNREKTGFEFSNGKDFRYSKNGDFEKGEFKIMKIDKSSPRNNKKTSAEEQNTSFQKKLAAERKAAAEEQTDSFQKSLLLNEKLLLKEQ